MDRIHLHIEGMTCNGCVRSVHDALAKQAGVVNVQVDLSGKEAWVTLAEGSSTSPDTLARVVEEAGFEIVPAEPPR